MIVFAMIRQLRIEYEEAFYRTISRGHQRNIIFFEDSDFMKFIEILKKTKERHNYILHAYYLMSNHCHLLIETQKANLNRLMQNINTSYAVFVNIGLSAYGIQAEMLGADRLLLKLSSLEIMRSSVPKAFNEFLPNSTNYETTAQ
ncbi:MAG: hypothetical protein IEMM0003_0057 [bacterium]|nr:MAG: hypothetical protein IEMM0003_0057 [bacterium]